MNDQPSNSDTKWMGAGMFAALFASLCCITPVFAFFAGIGGIGSMFSWVEPIRPYLIGITALLLGLAWYQKLKSKDEIDCECEDKPSFWRSTGFLSIITGLVILMLAFPYYADAFFPAQDKDVTYVQESRVKTITLDINGMTCKSCEASVEYAAKSLDGVLKADASFDTKTARITFDEGTVQQKDIEAAINTTGFTVAGSKEQEPPPANMKPFYDSTDICPLHGEGNCSGTCQARSTCTVEHLDQTVARAVDNDVAVEVTKLDNSINSLKNAFNNDMSHPRFVAVLSSVCRWCIDGAKKIKESLLEQDGTDDFRLYIIWMDMLEDDNFASAQKAAKLLNDPRVTHYYTSGKQVGREIAAQISGNEGVAWDIYLFYDKNARWENNFPGPADYVHQLNPDYYNWVEEDKYYSGEPLKQQLTDLTSKYKGGIQ